MKKVIGLIRATHVGPTFAVTSVAALLTWGAGQRSALAVGIAVALGQVSIGWSNDAHDAPRDLVNNRRDKPTVQGVLSARLLWVLAWCALALTIPMSFFAAGVLGGAAHVIAVLSAWAYNLRIKETQWSFVPYALSFGLLPFVIATPHWWVVVAFSLFGVGAHIANGVLDIDDDRNTHVFNAAVRLGQRRAELMAISLVLAALVLVVSQGSRATVWVLPLAAIVVALLRHRLFKATLVIAVAIVAVMVFSSAELFIG